MKHISIILCCTFLLSFSAHTQCTFVDLEVNTTSCDADLNFDAVISFLFANVGDNGFSVLGNGINHGSFSYDDLPVTIADLNGNCITPWEFIVRDNDDPSCSAVFELGEICCTEPCDIRDLVVETSECIDSAGYDLTFDFIHEGDIAAGFDLFINGDLYEHYDYSDLPVTIVDFPTSGFTQDQLLICDSQETDCCEDIWVSSACGCIISEMSARIIDCNEASETFYVRVDAEFFNVIDSFLIGGSGMIYGNFAYSDLPITLGPFDMDDTFWDFAMFDHNDAFCLNGYEIGVVSECPVCDISGMTAQVSQCNDIGELFVDISFDAVNFESDSFEVFGNATSYGFFPFGESVYRVGPILGDCETLYEFIVKDVDKPLCNDFIEFTSPICCPYYACTIEVNEYEITECNGDGNAYINFTLDVVSPIANQFEVMVNGESMHQYEYGQSAYEIGPLPGDCTTIYQIEIVDLENPDCSDRIFIVDPICCNSCDIRDLEVFDIECSSTETFNASINFIYENVTGVGFDLKLDGLAIGFYSYDDLPIRLIDQATGGETAFFLEVCENDNASCCESIVLEIPDCQEVLECSISDVFAEAQECDADGNFFVDIEFNNANPASNQFIIMGNGMVHDTFEYGETYYTIGPFIGDCQTIYEFIIVDLENGDCAGATFFSEPICCAANQDCTIDDLVVEQGACNLDGFFYANISFNAINPGSQFVVRGNGVVYDTFNYGESVYEIGPLEGDCQTIYEFVIIDLDFPDCQADTGFAGAVCCDCAIFDLMVTTGECTGDGTYEITIDFEYENVTNEFFDVIGPFGNLGFFKYTDLPITISDFPEREVDYDIIRICDNDNPDCCAVLEFMGPDCLIPCEINDLFVEAYECDMEGGFLVDFEFTDVSPDANQFVIRGNGVIYDTFEYGASFYTIGPLLGDCSTIYEFVVHDLENEDCQDVFVFEEPVCCDTVECAFGPFSFPNDLNVNADGILIFPFDMEYEGTGNLGFDLFINDQYLGFYLYDDLPIDLEIPLTTFGNFLLLRVCDNDSDCCEEFSITLDPEILCSLDNLSLEASECDSIFFGVTVDFLNAVIASDSFNIFGNGVDFGNFAYADLPIELGPLIGDDSTDYEFIVNDLIHSACSISGDLGLIDCGPSSTTDDLFKDTHLSYHNNILTVHGDLAFDKFILYDMQGRLIVQSSLTNNTGSLINANLMDGLYLVKLLRDQSETTILTPLFR